MSGTRARRRRPRRGTLRATCLVCIASLGLPFPDKAASVDTVPDERPWYVDAIATPSLTGRTAERPVVLAIVDDALLPEHPELARFVRVNTAEIAGNDIDDDGNGYVDDTVGWDVADDDADVRPPQERLERYYHGTHLGGVVVRVLNAALGDDAHRFVRILPVKSLSDEAATTALRSAYRGIDYAIDAGADVILCAWSANPISAEEERVLERAARRGITVVASAGNRLLERVQFPAAHESVIAVAAVDRLDRPLPESNHGSFVDLSAPGEDIAGSGVAHGHAESMHSGTSFSAAIVAAAAALLRLHHPTLSALERRACLVNHTVALGELRADLAGKFGSGRLDIAAAIGCDSLLDPAHRAPEERTRGYLVAREDLSAQRWRIAPPGRFRALRLTLASPHETWWKATLHVGSSDRDGGVARRFDIDPATPDTHTVVLPPGIDEIRLQTRDAHRDGRMLIAYRVETIDFSAEHCDGLQRLEREGILTDGSGDEDYAFHSDCQWLVTAPAGKLVRFDFEELATEPRRDLIYFFDGERSNAPVMAIFSGLERPPSFTTWRNEVLVWFLSDARNQFAGWKARITFVDE